MHPPQVRARALALGEAGCNDCEISRRLGIPRGTIRDWRHPTYLRKTPKYPGIIGSACSLLTRCFPGNPVDTFPYRDGNCLYVFVYSSHLGCVLPQHGLGKKHERPIVLERWQEAIVESEPWAFVRACIWTDGCAFINRTDIHRPQPYEYLSYQFSNMSKDIVDLLTAACYRVGVVTRVNRSRRGLWDVRINQRASVALMLDRVGLKR